MKSFLRSRWVGVLFAVAVFLFALLLFYLAFSNPSFLPKLTVATVPTQDVPFPTLFLITPTPAEDLVTTIAVTGDVLLARTVNYKMVSKNDFTWPFLQTYQKLREADISFINLETPLIADCPTRNDGMIFCGDALGIQGLQVAGIDVATIANNHIGNWGEEGVEQTVAILENDNIGVVGFQEPLIIEKKGIKFGFIGFNAVGKQPLVDNYSPELLLQRIVEAKQVSDVVIVQFHWGEEYRHDPTDFQIRVAHEAIDMGADLILGNHPHWVQPPEMYQGKLIVYSHGNFIFDQMWSEETRLGVVGWYTFRGKELERFEFLPIKIEDYGQPRWLEGNEGEWVRGVMGDNKKPIAL